MTEWTRMYLIVPAGLQAWANVQAAALDADGGQGTFSVPLSPTGLDPATHFGAAGLVRPTTRQVVLEQLVPNAPGTLAYDELDGWRWESALEHAGLIVIPAEEI